MVCNSQHTLFLHQSTHGSQAAQGCVCVSCFLHLPPTLFQTPPTCIVPGRLLGIQPLRLSTEMSSLFTLGCIQCWALKHMLLWKKIEIRVYCGQQNISTSSVFPKLRLMLGKNCVAAVLSALKYLFEEPHWLLGQIQCSGAKHEDNPSMPVAGSQYIEHRETQLYNQLLFVVNLLTDKLHAQRQVLLSSFESVH